MNDKKPFCLFVLISVLITYSAIIIFTHNYERFSADSSIYLNIAEKYLNGNFTDAVNGYWGPLLSWLFIPFLYVGLSPVFSVNALYLVVGLFTIMGVWILSNRFNISVTVRSSIMVALLPIMLFYSVVEIFDFLLVCLIVYYLAIIFKNDYPDKLHRGIFCGALGALAYFTKSYAFPFFIVHFLVMNVLHFRRYSARHEKRKVLRNAIAGYVMFVIISAPWITAISTKYDRLTFSNTGKGNFAAFAPELQQEGYEAGNPIFHKGFFPPAYKTANSGWEDPSYVFKDVKSWSPFESFGHFKHFIKHLMKNIFDCMVIYQSFSRFSITIMMVYILILAVQLFSKQVLRADLLYSFITVLLFTGGYMPFHFEPRYLWIINVLLLLMGGHILTFLFQNDFFRSNARKYILIVFFTLSFIMTPLKSVVQAGKDNMNKEMYIVSTILKDKAGIHGNLASNREWEHVALHDSWHKTFRLSYWLNSKYYGQARKDISDEALKSELTKFDIDYYFLWGESAYVPLFLSGYKEITGGEIPDLKVFSLKEKKKPEEENIDDVR